MHVLWSEAIRARWPDATVGDAWGPLSAVRSIKSPAEIALLRRAAEVTAAGFRAASATVVQAERTKTDEVQHDGRSLMFRIPFSGLRLTTLGTVLFAGSALVRPQPAQLKTVDAVLVQYQHALGGVEAISNVLSETRHGEVQATSMTGNATFIAYANRSSRSSKSRGPTATKSSPDLTAAFHGQSLRKARASIKPPRSKRCAGMPTRTSWSFQPGGTPVSSITSLRQRYRMEPAESTMPVQSGSVGVARGFSPSIRASCSLRTSSLATPLSPSRLTI
jgi:hypothetical protein